MKNKKFSLLYVDDEASNLSAFKNSFRREFDIHTADSGLKGIQLLEKIPIDVILSDQRMPDMTGVEFLKYALDKYPNTHRILVTGYTDFNALHHAINRAKIFKYVQKPWKKSKLKEYIDAGIQIQELEKKNLELNLKLSKSVDDLKNEIIQKENAQNILLEKNKELKEAKLKAEESDRLKGAFLSNISHEVRTPMNGINGFASLLISQDFDDTERKHFLETIMKCSKQLMFIMEQIIDVSTIDANQLVFNNSINDISSVFAEFKENFTQRCHEKKLQINWPDFQQYSHIQFSTDWGKFTKVISSLVDNAITYTQKGHVSIKLKITDKHIEFEICDTGVGIADNILPQIYKKFRQADDTFTKLSGGLGLGLSITKSYIDFLKGTIELKTEVNKGSVFTVSIPISITKPINKEPENNDFYSKKEFCVLVAEDEINNFQYLKYALLHLFPNVTIIHAKNGKDAVLDFEKHKDIDLILMDIKMPYMNGIEALKIIREQSASVPVIMQSAFMRPKTIQQAEESGCNSYVNKPVDIEELKEVVQKFVLAG